MTIKKKLGRPKKDNLEKRTMAVTSYYTDKEYKSLSSIAESRGLPLASFIREAVWPIK